MRTSLVVAAAAIALAGLAAVTPVSSQRAIMGVDFGHEFMKVSLVKQGLPFQVVANFQSKRKTPAMLALYGGERSFGADAEGLVGRKPHLVITSPQALLGRNATHPLASRLASGSFYGVATEVDEARGVYQFVIPTADAGAAVPPDGTTADGVRFSPEEAAAMLLAHARDFASHVAGLPVVDVVLTVPAYATQSERAALADAAELAGLSILGVVDENTAAGVQYGIDRVTENATHYMAIYNMGAEATQVSVLAYDSYTLADKLGGKNRTVGQSRVIGKAWDTQLGGRHYDRALIDHACDRINRDKAKALPASAAGDIRRVSTAMAKIRKAVVRTKEILSANEEYPLTIEGILPDVDFRMTISRTTLDDIAGKAGLTARITAPLEAALAAANITLATLDVVEVIGGGVRMPRVQTVLREYLAATSAAKMVAAGAPVELFGQHLNGDDSPALGAAFFGANRSVAFRVRKVGMIDGSAWGIGVRLTHLNATAAASAAAATADADDAAGGKAWSKRSTLYRPYESCEATKKIAFPADRDLRAVVSYEASAPGGAPLPEGTSRLVAAFNITGIAALMEREDTAGLGTPKVTIAFAVDAAGLIRVSRADATLETTVQELVPTPTPTGAPTPTANANASGNGTADAGEGAEATATAAPTAEATVAADGNVSVGNASEPVYRTVKKTLRYPLTVVDDSDSVLPVPRMSQAAREAALATLKRLAKADDERHARESAKNALEAYIYATRERRDGASEEELAAVSTEEQREAISEGLTGSEEWLYDEGAAADIDAYKARLRELKEHVEPVFHRLTEARNRPKLINDTTTYIATSRRLITGWSKTHPQITANETDDAVAAVDGLEKWFVDAKAKQGALAGHETPALTQEAAASRMKTVTALLTRLSKKPKPTPTPSPSPSTSAKAGKGGKKGGAGAGSAGGSNFNFDDFNFDGSNPELEEVLRKLRDKKAADEKLKEQLNEYLRRAEAEGAEDAGTDGAAAGGDAAGGESAAGGEGEGSSGADVGADGGDEAAAGDAAGKDEL